MGVVESLINKGVIEHKYLVWWDFGYKNSKGIVADTSKNFDEFIRDNKICCIDEKTIFTGTNIPVFTFDLELYGQKTTFLGSIEPANNITLNTFDEEYHVPSEFEDEDEEKDYYTDLKDKALNSVYGFNGAFNQTKSDINGENSFMKSYSDPFEKRHEDNYGVANADAYKNMKLPRRSGKEYLEAILSLEKNDKFYPHLQGIIQEITTDHIMYYPLLPSKKQFIFDLQEAITNHDIEMYRHLKLLPTKVQARKRMQEQIDLLSYDDLLELFDLKSKSLNTSKRVYIDTSLSFYKNLTKKDSVNSSYILYKDPSQELFSGSVPILISNYGPKKGLYCYGVFHQQQNDLVEVIPFANTDFGREFAKEVSAYASSLLNASVEPTTYVRSKGKHQIHFLNRKKSLPVSPRQLVF